MKISFVKKFALKILNEINDKNSDDPTKSPSNEIAMAVSLDGDFVGSPEKIYLENGIDILDGNPSLLRNP